MQRFAKIVKGIINPQNQFFIQNILYHIDLLELAWFLKSRDYFLQKITKIGCNKNAIFFTDISFVFTNSLVNIYNKYIYTIYTK